MNLLYLLLFCFLLPLQAWPLNIETEDFAVQFPRNWTCDPDENLFICTETDSGRQKAAIVLINYKMAAPTETLAEFRSKLQKPKSIQVEGGAPRLSRVISFQDRSINGLTWVEALHFEGELPDYYTYYVATRKASRFFLVTLSAHSDSWDNYRPQFESIISSLRILAQEPSPTPKPQINTVETPQKETKMKVSKKEEPSGFKPSEIFLFSAVVIFGLVVLYAFRS